MIENQKMDKVFRDPVHNYIHVENRTIIEMYDHQRLSLERRCDRDVGTPSNDRSNGVLPQKKDSRRQSAVRRV